MNIFVSANPQHDLSNGKAADEVVGHRLSFTGNRFQIQSKRGGLLDRWLSYVKTLGA